MEISGQVDTGPPYLEETESGTHRAGGWAGLRAGLDVKILLLSEMKLRASDLQPNQETLTTVTPMSLLEKDKF
jgi:hypothetical protein